MEFLGLYWDKLLGLAIAIMLALITMAGRLARRAPRQRDGWFYLTLTASLWVMVPMSLLITVFGAAMPVIAVLAPHQDGPIAIWWGLALSGPFLALLGLYSFFYLTCVRFRYCETGFERRLLHRHVLVAWSEVAAIRYHWFWGPQIVGRDRKTYAVWEYLCGFPALIAMAKTHGIPVTIPNGGDVF